MFASEQKRPEYFAIKNILNVGRLLRLHENEVVITQELIANLLGVRRESITEAAGKLQKEGFITYSRGLIKVLDRLKLEMKVCECYRVVRKEFDRLLPHPKNYKVGMESMIKIQALPI